MKPTPTKSRACGAFAMFAGTILVLVLSGCDGGAKSAGAKLPPAAHAPAAFPTRPGTHTAGEWRYEYTVSAPGTRSERRCGRLFESGVEIVGKLGEVRETPLGQFAYFGPEDRRYNAGWLNTLTYDKPVFGVDGRILPELGGYFISTQPAAP